ncbi:MAG TPA: PLP-dependent cysteine synthase family protein [Devosia sp.]|nr:PLP-dependent cysteine synthase family protein [Devosia sp.]
MSLEWRCRAIALLESEGKRSADTNLLELPLEGFDNIDCYLKDESSHPTGSLKHRLARSLFLYGICNGQIQQGTMLVEASSGSTAVSEAYYARLLGLDFCAVLPRNTSTSKVEAITRQGGRCHFVDDPATMYQVAEDLAHASGGYYLDQFTFAERATDWRSNNNIAESIFKQMENERHSVPRWIVMSAGTGGTSATLGRYIRYRCLATQLCVPDVEFSAFYAGWSDGDRAATSSRPSRIEGIGRPRVEKSFIPGVVDAMVQVTDAASLAGMMVLTKLLGRRVGASTGTNFIGLLWTAAAMRRAGEAGSLVTLICDSGERYADSYFDANWLAAQGFDLAPQIAMIEATIAGAEFAPALLLQAPNGTRHAA